MGFLAAALPFLGVGAETAGTLATVGEVASIAGGVVGAVGAVEGAAAQQKSAEFQAQVATNNAQLAKQQAALTEAAGAAQVETQGIKTRAEVGAIKAEQAASNIDVDSGSALDVRSSAAMLGELDALTIRSNAEKTAYGDLTQAKSFEGQASVEKSIAAEAPIAGGIQAFGSVLGGAASAGNTYLRWQQAAGSPSSAPALF